MGNAETAMTDHNQARLTEPVPIALLSAEEVSRITGLSTETLAQWRSQGRGITYVKISRNCIRYRDSDLEVWLEERTVRVPAEPSGSRRRN
jgi:predicted DNA-binding transcriptional regulator AlpA